MSNPLTIVSSDRVPNRPKRSRLMPTVLLLTFALPTCAAAQTGTLAEPFPAPARNAALHYQRALLHLSALGDAQKRPLEVPVWESLPVPAEKSVPARIAALLYAGRYATRAATSGTRTADCDFGIDFATEGAATQLPHLEGMLALGRLLTLRGAFAEATQEWEEAAIIYFDGLRMARHLTSQNTLLEAVVGIEILRNNYYALARWSVRCPSRPLVARAFGLLEAMQQSLIDPPRVLARESSIMTLEFGRLREAFPDGNWAEMVLESYGEEAAGDRQQNIEKAIRVCVERGVPRDTLNDSSAFHSYLEKLQTTAQRYVEAVAAATTLPARPRLERARSLDRKYADLITVFAQEALINAENVVTLLSEHEAELTVARLALAVAASKQDGRYPASLAEIAERFGGEVPVSPYTRDSVTFNAFDERSEFSLLIPPSSGLPSVSFTSQAPAAVE